MHHKPTVVSERGQDGDYKEEKMRDDVSGNKKESNHNPIDFIPSVHIGSTSTSPIPTYKNRVKGEGNT